MPLSAQSTGALNGHEYVDLALPSGLKWATCNIGASKPEAQGSYFAWGETKPKDEYTQGNSVTYGKQMDDISGNAQYDAATANWGEGCRIPTKAEMYELVDCCAWEWTRQNGVKGYKLTGPNGNSIFLPETGYMYDDIYTNGSCYASMYWVSTPSVGYNNYCDVLYFNSLEVGASFDIKINDTRLIYNRSNGSSIRPVMDVVVRPTILTSVENYTDKTAIVKTYVSSNTEITERGFYYGTNPEPSEADNKVVMKNVKGYENNALMNLTPNTTYYVKAYATNSVGISYSEVVSFTTLENPIEYEYVDLGLPSGLKWATHNIGATSPEEYGNYYAWGEVYTKETYSGANSLTYNQGMLDISGTEYDAATFNWSGNWRMPTNNEMQELIDNCIWKWTTQNGVNGYKVTSKINDNYIFMPAAGTRSYESLINKNNNGYYWSSVPNSNNGSASCLNFRYGRYSMDWDYSYNYRYYGSSIRPVMDVAESPTISLSLENYTDKTAIVKTYVLSNREITERGFYYGTNPEPSEADNKVVMKNVKGYENNALMNLTPNTTYYVKAYATNSVGISYSEVVSFTTLENPIEYEYVDLGLPSGLKWATHNIGATSPEEYGNYYAWGEVYTKETYSQENSETYGKSMDNISGTEYDAATFNWGGDWRMQTYNEMQELIDNCIWEWTTQNGVNGYKVTSKVNENSIFLPAAGYRVGESLDNAADYAGYYWGSTLYAGRADCFYFDSSSHLVGVFDLYYGFSIRPVRE